MQRIRYVLQSFVQMSVAEMIATLHCQQRRIASHAAVGNEAIRLEEIRVIL